MMELADSDVNHENASPNRDEENKRILSASTFPASPHLDDKLSDVLHSGCFILPRELGENWHFEPWREQYLIVTRGIWCPVHA
jgi:hypothetical protein